MLGLADYILAANSAAWKGLKNASIELSWYSC